MSERPPRSLATPGLVLCLACSGAAGLIYETVWARQLAYAFSSTAVTSLLVLASFMGGMALGSALAGRLAPRLAAPLAAYGWLELALALCGATWPAAIDRVSVLYLSLARGAAPGVGLFALRFGLFAALLAVPALLMGATLPLVVPLIARARGGAGRGLGLLYAVNSAGGVAGCLAAGFVLIEMYGLSFTSAIGAALNAVAGIGALALRPFITAPPDAVAASPSPAPEARPDRGLALALAVSGFTAIGYEVLWARTLPLILGSSTYSFALMLATFVAGVTAGSFAFERLAERLPEPRRTVALAQVAIGAWVLVTMPLYAFLPWPFVFVRSALDVSFGSFQAIALALNALVMAVPAFLFGVGLPAAVEARARAGGRVSQVVGDLYAANTLGNLAGALVTGLWLIPVAGTPASFQLCALANLASGAALAPALVTGRAPRVRLACALALVGVLAPPATRAWLETLGMGGYSRMRAGGWTDASRRLRAQTQQQVIFREEDPVGTVLVSERNRQRSLWVSGKVDASNTGDMGTQLLLALLPLAMHEAPHRVFVLGLGSGVTAGAALLDRRLAEVDACEISPGVVHASKFFEEVNFGWGRDPRGHTVVDDGRHFLATGAQSYDVITMEPSNPWMAGITGLYTREFLQLARAHLAPGGLMVQWTHLYEIDETSLHLITRTFQEAFPHARAFRSDMDLLLVGAAEPATLEASRVVRLLSARLQDPAIAAALSAQGLEGAFALCACELFDAASLARWTGPGPVLTDDHPDLEFSAPLAYYAGTAVPAPRDQLPLADSLVSAYLAGRRPTAAEVAALARYRVRVKQVIGLPGLLLDLAPGDPVVQELAARAYLMLDEPDAALPLARAASDTRPADAALARTYREAARRVEEARMPLLTGRRFPESEAAEARLR